VYGVSISSSTDSCGTSILVSVYVDDDNAKRVMVETFKLLRRYVEELVPKKYLSAMKKKSITGYEDTSATASLVGSLYANQYIKQLGYADPVIRSIKEYNDCIKSLTRGDVKRALSRVLTFNDCLCAYQGKSKLNVTWSDLL